jgi:hypothetical protein
MERIVIEVDEATGKKWNLAPSKFKKDISEKISESISKILDDNRKENFLAYLDEIGEKMKQRGLTEEIVNDILQGDD